MKRVIVAIELPSGSLAELIYKSIRPEIESQPSSSARATAIFKGRYITFVFEARSAAGVRALVNSYLRWVDMILKLAERLEV